VNSLPDRVLVAGANGHLGRKLLARLPRARALVRRAGAADAIHADGLHPEIAIAAYDDADALKRAADGCSALVHLVGILKEGPTTTYEVAHEQTSERLANAAAAAGISRIVYLSIVGSTPESPNACLASKGRAERILLDGPVPTRVLRLPMVLGPGDYASAALRGKARAKAVPLIRGGATLEQPIDANDVLDGIDSTLAAADPDNDALDLAGPENLTHRELVMRAAALYDNRPRIIPIPYGLMRMAVSLMGAVSKAPPITIPMLEVLEHDDRADAAAAAKQLGIELTPLDDTLRRCVGPEAETA
jgi:uncharacterized protein YbjT (DUF2867 family)